MLRSSRYSENRSARKTASSPGSAWRTDQGWTGSDVLLGRSKQPPRVFLALDKQTALNPSEGLEPLDL
jgi:hypothetical protein